MFLDALWTAHNLIVVSALRAASMHAMTPLR
jgi:hypothetical protein